MKNIIGVDFSASETFVGDLPVNDLTQRRVIKTSSRKSRRESVTPKIVVCPPVEEMTDSTPPPVPRGARILKALGRRLSRRSTDDDSVGSSNSNDSSRTDDHSSCSASESSSDSSDHHRRHRSTMSLRRVFQSLSLTSRSQSSSPTDRQRQPKKQTQPKRILRPPVTYTYVRGLSGLPTQRVPRHTVCYATTGLNR